MLRSGSQGRRVLEHAEPFLQCCLLCSFGSCLLVDPTMLVRSHCRAQCKSRIVGGRSQSVLVEASTLASFVFVLIPVLSSGVFLRSCSRLLRSVAAVIADTLRPFRNPKCIKCIVNNSQSEHTGDPAGTPKGSQTWPYWWAPSLMSQTRRNPHNTALL